jgi:hypothetical protein
MGRLIGVCAELRKSVHSAARALRASNDEFDDGAAFGIAGVCRFELDAASGELRFQFGASTADAVIEAPDGGFICVSNPTQPVDALGLLRGRLLDMAMRSSRPPPPDVAR